jgi:uroporphyrinogen-III synthase
LLQYCLWLFGVLAKVATCSAPAVTFTASGFQSVKAFTGAADQDRHELQWQYPIASGSPVTST